MSFLIGQNKRYDLVISIHHFSYEDSVVAIGSFLEFVEDANDESGREQKTTIPIKLKPYTVSLEQESFRLKQNLEDYIRDIVKIGLTIIANEIA